jgi:hypothetical protein
MVRFVKCIYTFIFTNTIVKNYHFLPGLSLTWAIFLPSHRQLNTFFAALLSLYFSFAKNHFSNFTTFGRLITEIVRTSQRKKITESMFYLSLLRSRSQKEAIFSVLIFFVQESQIFISNFPSLTLFVLRPSIYQSLNEIGYNTIFIWKSFKSSKVEKYFFLT